MSRLRVALGIVLLSACANALAAPRHGDDGMPVPVWEQWDDATFRALQDRAWARSPSLAQAMARVDEARASERAARAELLPAVDATASRQRRRTSDGELDQFPGQPRYNTQVDLGIDFRWEIDLFGVKRAQRDAARAQRIALGYELEAARLRLSAELARQYVVLRAGDLQQQAEQRLLELLREQDFIDAALEREGLLAAAERRPVQAELAEREASLRDGESARIGAVARLRTLLGGPADANPILPASDSGFPLCRLAIPREVPVSVLDARPDIRAAQERFNATTADARAARRLRWPNLVLSGRGGWTGESSGELIRASNLGGQLLASLGLRLLDFGRLKAQAQAAQARQAQAESFLAEAILQAAEEADLSIAEVSRALHFADRSATARDAIEASAEISRARWEAGLDSRRKLLDAQRAALERVIAGAAAEQALCESQIQFALAIAPVAPAEDSAASRTQER